MGGGIRANGLACQTNPVLRAVETSFYHPLALSGQTTVVSSHVRVPRRAVHGQDLLLLRNFLASQNLVLHTANDLEKPVGQSQRLLMRRYSSGGRVRRLDRVRRGV